MHKGTIRQRRLPVCGETYEGELGDWIETRPCAATGWTYDLTWIPPLVQNCGPLLLPDAKEPPDSRADLSSTVVQLTPAGAPPKGDDRSPPTDQV